MGVGVGVGGGGSGWNVEKTVFESCKYNIYSLFVQKQS